jgi:hypothetical protein
LITSLRPAALQRGMLIALTVASSLVPALAVPTMVGAASSVVPQAAAPLTMPPPVTVLRRSDDLARGDIFIAPLDFSGTASTGPEIVDDRGRPIWFQSVPVGQATDFRTQTYEGRPVLTWWQGRRFGGASSGVDEIADQSYRLIATVRAGNGLSTDGHEFFVTPWGTALITSYDVTTADLTALGGTANQKVIDGVVQEIDIRTGQVLFEWHSIGHVPFSDSFAPLPPVAALPWDYFHVNAIHLDRDGNFLISSRHTSTVFKVNRRTGAIMWQLGGKHSTFALGPGVQFAFQHDIEAIGRDLYTIFDNESAGQPVMPASRVITLRLDPDDRTATLVSSLTHPDGISASSQGNAQTLPNRDIFVGWGSTGRLSELSHSGDLLFDATLPSTADMYRAYRLSWHATPATPPSTTFAAAGTGSLVHAIWNGATDVAHWRVLAGSSPDHLRPVASADWNGLDTAIAIATQPKFVQVVALNAEGETIGRSSITT